MHTVTCTVPGLGGTSADQAPRQESLATEYMGHLWTVHTCELSHDGESNVIHREDGFELLRGSSRTRVKADLMRIRPREFMWGPDNRHLLMWAPQTADYRFKRVAVLDATRLQGGTVDTIGDESKAPWEVVYDAGAYHHVEGGQEDKEVVQPDPFGFEWSPAGEAVFVIERLYYTNDPHRGTETVILRIDLASGAIRELVRMSGQIDFFMPPVSRFENGSGPSPEPYQIAFGHHEGLFLVDPQPHGERRSWRRVSTLPADHLRNVEWNPTAPQPGQLLLYFDRAVLGADGSPLGSVVLVHLDRVGFPERGEWMEQLYDGLDVHTLWYSPRGSFATWATPNFVAYRRPLDGAEKTVRVVCRSEGALLEIKGVHWHPGERYLAIAAGSRLFVHDVQRQETREVARFGEDDSLNFVAEPRWVGDTVLLSRFEDVREAAKEYRSKPHLRLPKRPAQK